MEYARLGFKCGDSDYLWDSVILSVAPPAEGDGDGWDEEGDRGRGGSQPTWNRTKYPESFLYILKGGVTQNLYSIFANGFESENVMLFRPTLTVGKQFFLFIL